MEKFKNYWGFAAMIIGGCVGVLGWFYNQGASSQELNGKVFDSPEQKVEVVRHVNNSPTPAQLQKQRILDSINAVHAVKSRAKRDSLMQAEYKARRRADSINLLNADQLYQIKQELKALKEKR